jgi:hypothetical protein
VSSRSSHDLLVGFDVSFSGTIVLECHLYEVPIRSVRASRSFVAAVGKSIKDPPTQRDRLHYSPDSISLECSEEGALLVELPIL